MPIGKDSITKRVINATEPAPETELPGRTPKKAPAKRKKVPEATPAAETAMPVAESVAETFKPAPTSAETLAEVAVPAVPATAVMGNVSPEVVEKVTGHPEDKEAGHVAVTDAMPFWLL